MFPVLLELCKYQQHLWNSATHRYIEESLTLWTTWYIDHTHTHTHTHCDAGCCRKFLARNQISLPPLHLRTKPQLSFSSSFLAKKKKLNAEKFILFRVTTAVRKLNESAKCTLWISSFDVNIIGQLHYELRDTSEVTFTQKLWWDKKV